MLGGLKPCSRLTSGPTLWSHMTCVERGCMVLLVWLFRAPVSKLKHHTNWEPKGRRWLLLTQCLSSSVSVSRPYALA
jgi:hypothetical protein